jgi:hypothetical protein
MHVKKVVILFGDTMKSGALLAASAQNKVGAWSGRAGDLDETETVESNRISTLTMEARKQ